MTLCSNVLITPTYEPKVGWSRLTRVTGGTMPSFEDFEGRFDVVCPNGLFPFTNDKRVGDESLTVYELWDELHTVWETRNNGKKGDFERAYSWCSDVLGILGWEWV